MKLTFLRHDPERERCLELLLFKTAKGRQVLKQHGRLTRSWRLKPMTERAKVKEERK